MPHRLLILHDSPDFGGHERMFLQLLPALLDDDRRFAVTVRFPAENQRFRAGLEPFDGALRLAELPFVKGRGEPYMRHLRWRYRDTVRRIVADEGPDTVLLLQGRIENLAVPMSVIPRNVRLVSYLPMAHRLSEMGRAAIGDRFRRALYGRPDHFIVPSEAVAAQVKAAGGRAPVTVAHNVVAPPPRSSRAEARRMLDLPETQRIALLPGRLENAQKGIDRLLAAIDRATPDRLGDWSFVFVGDGPARPQIEQHATRARGRFRIVPWTDRPDLFLSAADILLMPSRWEGVPLTMLEAMRYGLPILASDIDVFRLYLPPSHIADFDRIDLGETLDRLVQPDMIECFACHAEARVRPLTLESARDRFRQALSQEAG